MRFVIALVFIFIASGCSVVDGLRYQADTERGLMDASDGLRNDFDQVFADVEKYETEDYIGYRVNFGGLKPSRRILQNLKGVFITSCEVKNVGGKGLYVFSDGGRYINPIYIDPEPLQLPMPENIEMGSWTSGDFTMTDLICAKYDDRESYPSKKTLRSVEYMKVLREWQVSEPGDDYRYSNNFWGHIILYKPHYVYEQIIRPAQEQYEKEYIQRLREAKTMVGALEADLQKDVKFLVVLQENRDKHEVQFVVDNESGKSPIKLKVSSVGELQIDNVRYAVTWNESADGRLIANFDWSSSCSPVDNDHTVVVNPSQHCVAKLPVEIKGAEFDLNKKYSIKVFGKNVQLRPVSKYELMYKHPTVFNEAP